jgi:ABC-type glycerol-3-phosphate transport system substrate-binding protein
MAIGMETGPEGLPLPLGPRAATDITEGDSKKPADPIERVEGIRLGVAHLPGGTRVYDRSHEEFTAFPADRPHFVALGGFAGLGVVVAGSAARSGASVDAAWDLAEHLTGDDRPTTFPPPLGSPVDEPQTSDAAAFAGRQLRPDEQARWMDAVAATLGNADYESELPIIGRQRFRAALTRELGPVLEGDARPADALRNAAEAWRSIVDQIGVEKVQKSCRDGLGAVGS